MTVNIETNNPNVPKQYSLSAVIPPCQMYIFSEAEEGAIVV